MRDNSRTKKSIVNASAAVLLQVVFVLLSFVVRTFFVSQLGNEYLSLNGLFTNIVALLSFAELGIGNAIIFSLYKPLIENDYEKINSLMVFFKKAYRFIRITILVLGISLSLFLNQFINGVDTSIHYHAIFFLFLANTYFSYVFSYKKTLLIADQKNYAVLLAEKGFFTIQSIIQCFILVHYHNYYVFLIVQILGTIAGNIVVSRHVDKIYAQTLCTKSVSLNPSEIKKIFTDIKSIFLYKFGAVILNGTDNLLISSLIATAYVGVYSNYALIIQAINGILMQACNSLAGIIGQHIVSHKGKDGEKVFLELFFISFWAFGVCSVCLSIFLNPFIELWLGREYLLGQWIVLLTVVVFYITGINQIPSLYRTSQGLFRDSKWLPIIAALLNIVLSIIGGKMIGIAGIFLATAIARLCTFNLFDPWIVYKKGFHLSSIHFYMRKMVYLLCLCVNYAICAFIQRYISSNGWTGLVFEAIIIFITSNIIFLILFAKNTTFQNIMKRIRIRSKNGK